jgi:predicted RNase H-like HicB family nuclease
MSHALSTPDSLECITARQGLVGGFIRGALSITPRAAGCKLLLDAESGWRYYDPMTVQFTAVFRPVPGGYVAYVEELPGANTQGATLDEARANLEEAVSLVLEANRTLAREDAAGVDVIREPLQLTA